MSLHNTIFNISRGLYYHYHSVEEILFDVISAETGDVWVLFDKVHDIESLIAAQKEYFQIEQSDLLEFDHTLNSIFFQYYFSFPADIRKNKMEASYQATIASINAVFERVFALQQHVKQLSHHFYVVLNGLNVLAMSGTLTSDIINHEFSELERFVRHMYEEETI